MAFDQRWLSRTRERGELLLDILRAEHPLEFEAIRPVPGTPWHEYYHDVSRLVSVLLTDELTAARHRFRLQAPDQKVVDG